VSRRLVSVCRLATAGLATRATMLRIEQRAAAECDVPELHAAIRDDCTRASCGAPAIAVH